MYLVCVPAYGRDYKSKKELQVDWEAGKDFRVENIMSKWDGKYFSVRDTEELKKEGTTHIQIRYKRLTQIHIIKL